MDSRSYLSSFAILSDDFRRLTEFVEPSDDNIHVYSYRIYELLLRACTDFESVCKEKLIEDGYLKDPEDMNIYDYKKLETTLKLESVEIGLLFWRPNIVYIKPFENWSTNKPPLSWYSAYNTVKHNRKNKFSFASLNNLRLSLSGLFSILVTLGFMGNVVEGGHTDDKFSEFFYHDKSFSYKCPVDKIKELFPLK